MESNAVSIHSETGVGRGNGAHHVGPYKKTVTRIKTILRSLRIGAGVSEACQLAGIAPSTLTLWFDDDQRLKAKVYNLLDSRVWQIEDKMFARLVSGEASPAEYFFYLKNRMPDRWNIEGRDGKPNTEYIQLVLNKILFIIGDTVKDDNVKKIISQKLYELGNEAEVKVPKQVSIDGEYLPKQLRRTVVNDPTSKNGNVELKPVEGVVVK